MSEQARAVDIHEWCRTGGIDADRMKLNFDVVGIRAVVGKHVDALLVEHVNLCQYHNIPYFTYCIPGLNVDPDWQADFYLDQYGVSDGLVCGDIEPETRGGTMAPEYHYRRFFERLDNQRSDAVWYYSNYAYTKAIGNPGWIKGRPVFWAEYRYQFYPYLYRKFEPFLDNYTWWQPRWATSFGIDVTLNQFTDKGDAQYYLANAITKDPNYRVGIKSADLSVALVEKSELLALWAGLIEPQPTLEQRVDDLEQRVTKLESQ